MSLQGGLHDPIPPSPHGVKKVNQDRVFLEGDSLLKAPNAPANDDDGSYVDDEPSRDRLDDTEEPSQSQTFTHTLPINDLNTANANNNVNKPNKTKHKKKSTVGVLLEGAPTKEHRLLEYFLVVSYGNQLNVRPQSPAMDIFERFCVFFLLFFFNFFCASLHF